jgi:hypothetical protein
MSRSPLRLTRAGTTLSRRIDQKLGFHGATPTIQRASADQAAATDPTSTMTLTNELRAALVEKGIIKGSALLILFLGILMLAVLSTIPARASVTTDSPGVTNTVAASTTITTGLGAASDVRNNEHVGIMLLFRGLGPSAGNVTLTLARSTTGITYETTPQISVTVAANGTNAVVFATNLVSSVIGDWGYLKPVSLQNAATNSLTNVVLQIIRKNIY